MELAQKDEAGNLYIETNNVRITYVNKEKGNSLKIQPYKNQPDGSSLCKGTEIPLNDSYDFLTLIGELSLLHKAIKYEILYQHEIPHQQV